MRSPALWSEGEDRASREPGVVIVTVRTCNSAEPKWTNSHSRVSRILLSSKDQKEHGRLGEQTTTAPRRLLQCSGRGLERGRGDDQGRALPGAVLRPDGCGVAPPPALARDSNSRGAGASRSLRRPVCGPRELCWPGFLSRHEAECPRGGGVWRVAGCRGSEKAESAGGLGTLGLRGRNLGGTWR